MSAAKSLPKTAEWLHVDPETFRNEIVPRDRPAVLKAVAAHWPVVQAGRQSPRALCEYLRVRDNGTPTRVFLASAAIGGMFFYRDDMTGLNFERASQPFYKTAEAILSHLDDRDPPAIYAPAAPAPQCFPQFVSENALAIVDDSVVPRLWLGNGVTAPTHYDMEDGLACVAAGRKRFTLFPPEQFANLYVGPLDMAPGGLPTSMVKLAEPDFERYPRFEQALAAAEVAELEAGDAVYIPNMWWHNVESLDPINLLVNYWWYDGARGAGSPFAAMAYGIMAISAWPESRRKVWRQMFDQYVFRTDGDPVPYLPPGKRGMLGPMNPKLETYMRTQIVRSLTRALPKACVEQIERWIATARPSADKEQPYG